MRSGGFAHPIFDRSDEEVRRHVERGGQPQQYAERGRLQAALQLAHIRKRQIGTEAEFLLRKLPLDAGFQKDLVEVVFGLLHPRMVAA